MDGDAGVLRVPLLETPLRDVMTPGVVAVPDGASLHRVLDAMRAHRIHAILVLAREGGAPLGWVTSRALLAWADNDLSLVDAVQAIDEPAVTLPPTATAGEALEALRARSASHIAVCDDASRMPEGIVTDLDLAILLAGRGERR